MSAKATASGLFSVAGKNVLVTGGSRGIGEMIAGGFAAAGANVVITSRDADVCAKTAATIGCDYIASNVSTREGCKDLVETVRKKFNGRLDVLVNNAGASWGEEVYERESGRMNWGWDKVMDLNVKGVFYLTRECVPLMERPSIPSDDPGRVINIGSIAGFVPQEAPTHAYDVSKAAVHHLTKKMSTDLAKRGITVNAVAPGYVPSRMSAGLASWGAEPDKMAKGIPLGRMGNEDDMSGACIYLSSRAGAWCTGVILNVDGGSVGSLQIPMSSL